MKKIIKFLSKILYTNEWDYDRCTYNIGNNPQKDWNQTLMTKVNHASAMIHKENDTGGANALIIPQSMVDIFKTLTSMKLNKVHFDGYYELGVVASRYIVYVIPDLDDDHKVYVCHVKNHKDIAKIKNYKMVGVVKLKNVENEEDEGVTFLGHLDGVPLYYDKYQGENFILGKKDREPGCPMGPKITFIIGGTKDLEEYEIALIYYRKHKIL